MDWSVAWEKVTLPTARSTKYKNIIYWHYISCRSYMVRCIVTMRQMNTVHTLSYPISLRYILILYSHPCLGLSSGFPTKVLCAFPHIPLELLTLIIFLLMQSSKHLDFSSQFHFHTHRVVSVSLRASSLGTTHCIFLRLYWGHRH